MEYFVYPLIALHFITGLTPNTCIASYIYSPKLNVVKIKQLSMPIIYSINIWRMDVAIGDIGYYVCCLFTYN